MARIVRHGRYIVLESDAGIRGALLASDEVKGGYALLAGLDEKGAEDEIANRPVKLDGSGVLLSGAGGYFFKVPDGTDPADVENHYAKFGSVGVAPDGNSYASLEVGPGIPLDILEKFTDVTDYSLTPEDVPEVVVTGTLASNYTATTTFDWECLATNDGDRAADYVVQPRVDGVPLGPPTTVTLSGGQQLITGNVNFAAPPTAGTVVDLEVTATNWAHPSRPDPWIRGTIQASRIEVYQLAPQAGVASFQSLSDTPDLFAGQAGKVVAVKATEDGLEFANPAQGGAPLEEMFSRSHEAATAIGTTLATLDWDTARFADAGFSYATGEVEILAAIAGRRATIDVAVHADTDANSRVQLEVELQADTGSGFSAIRRAYNYATRNNSQDKGGAWITGWPVDLVLGDKYRVQIRRVGATANTVPLGCHWTIRTIYRG